MNVMGTIVGLHGKLGSGKDTVYERMAKVLPVTQVSFADKLKDSACSLLKITREEMERYKRDEDGAMHQITLTEFHQGGVGRSVTRLTMREYLQRYGTESHRDIFGQDFWIDQALPLGMDIDPNTVYAVTDCRFLNEALRIKELGGLIVRVNGVESDTGAHASEVPLPDHLIDLEIDNTIRNDHFASLDLQIQELFVNESSTLAT